MRLGCAIVAFACMPVVAHGQSVAVQVRDGAHGGPLAGALAEVVDADGAVATRTLSDELGRALLRDFAAGRYRLRVEMIGRATAVTDFVQIEAGEVQRFEVILDARPIELAGIEIARDRRCRQLGGDGDGRLLERLWDEARKALAVTSHTADRGAHQYLTELFEHSTSRDGAEITGESWTRREGYMRRPFESRPAEELNEGGYVQEIEGETLFLAPSAEVLLSDSFVEDHCFHIERQSDGRTGLGFRSAGRTRGQVGISGVMWLDDTTSMLSSLEYRYEGLDPDQTTDSVGGRVDFARLPDGNWMIPEWWIRMPIVIREPGFDGRTLTYVSGYKVAGGRVLDVKTGGGRALVQSRATGSIEGFVVDSLGVPVVGASVAVAGSRQEVFTDARGRFGITRLREGTYELRATPRARSSLLIRDATDSVTVVLGEASEVTLYMERAAARVPVECERPAPVEGVVGLLALVVDDSGTPVEGMTVRVMWNDYNFNGVVAGRQARDIRRLPRAADATTSEDGEVLFCDLPARSRLSVFALDGEGVSNPFDLVIDDVELGRAVELSPESFLRPLPTAEALVVRVVDGRERALSGAEVRLPELGRSTLADATGRAVFTSVPLGQVALRVESLGRVSRDDTVSVVDTLTTVVTVPMGQGAFDLEPIVVEVETPESRARRVSGSSAFLALSHLDIQELVDSQGIASLGELIDAGGLGRFQWENVSVGRQYVGSCLRHSRTSRGLMALRGETHTCVQVVLNGAWLSVPESVSLLRSLPVGDIESIQFLPPSEATMRFGTSSEDKATHNGVFVIETRRGGG